MRVFTIIILIIIAIIFSTNIQYNTGQDAIDYPIRAFYHADLQHLLANGISLYNLSFMEDVLGRTKFLSAILFIWIVSSLLLYLFHTLIPSRKVYTIGFSGVIFGLIVVYFSLLGNKNIGLAGLIISILPQIFVPGISFEGHLAGIISGIIYITIFPLNKTLKI